MTISGENPRGYSFAPSFIYYKDILPNNDETGTQAEIPPGYKTRTLSIT